MPRRRKLYSDQVTITVENGKWVARFLLNGIEQWKCTSEAGAEDAVAADLIFDSVVHLGLPKHFSIKGGIRSSIEVKS